MPPAENTALVCRFYEEAWANGALGVIDELFADDYVRHDLRPTQPAPGPEGMKQITADFRSAFPDLRFDVEMTIAEGELVAARACRAAGSAGLRGRTAGLSQRSRISTASPSASS